METNTRGQEGMIFSKPQELTGSWSLQNESFRSIKQLASPGVILDHKPLLLESGEWDSTTSYFKFENMWLQREGFIDMVKGWWQNYTISGNPDFVLIQKLRSLKKDISKWNKEVYGMLDTKISMALDEFLALEQATESRAPAQAEKQRFLTLRMELEEIAKAEEISWRLSEKESELLEKGFEEDEVYAIIQSCAPDKAPGLDGFTMSFFQKSWDFIKPEIMATLNYFHQHCYIERSCNASFIALIPKKKGSIELMEYIPISLIGSVYKIVAKVLAERLKKVIGKLVSSHQNAFIKHRHITDAALIANKCWTGGLKLTHMVLCVNWIYKRHLIN
ncbi:uncharacterized protein LOC142177236 [Nicotiana tabacum]|uniref:Uncharacterized protein LOC142177236 n=1 Tax=Nicotiana tabacum TaxID=4097 RepID=A0AC58TX44_TOBAC